MWPRSVSSPTIVCDASFVEGCHHFFQSLLADTLWASSDHLMGLPVLSDRDTSCEHPALLSIYEMDQRMTEQAVLHSRNCLRETNFKFAADDLGDGDSASSCDVHRSQLVAILERLRVPLEIVTNDASAVALDYEPGIRRLLLIEEVNEQEVISSATGNNGGTRTTKNSQGQRESIKLLYLDANHRQVLTRSPFRIEPMGRWAENL